MITSLRVRLNASACRWVSHGLHQQPERAYANAQLMSSGTSCELICEILPLISATNSIAKYAHVYTKGFINSN